jgi:glycosyltransferase involved in cell wall biosynthesis
VVSDVCGLSELVDDAVGFVVDAENAEQVAQALLSEWGPLIRESARVRADQYSVETMINGLESVYEKICNES